MNAPKKTQEYRISAGDSLTGATAIRLLSRPQAGRKVEIPLPPPRRLFHTFVGAIGIGSTAAAVGALYITLSAVFPPGTLGFFLIVLGVAVLASIGASYRFHGKATDRLALWLKRPSEDVDLGAWYQALNYPIGLSLTVGVAALVVSAVVAVITGVYAGSLTLGLHIAVGGALAAVLDAIFAWLFTDHGMRPILQAIAARNPLLPVSGPQIVSLGLGAKMAIVIIGVSVVGAVVVGTLAYRGAEEAVAHGNVDGLALQILGVTLAGLAVSLSGCLLVARHVTGPLEDLTQMLEELIPERYSSRALPIDSDEAGQLMAAVNHMLGGLEEREFIKDAFSRYVTRQVSEVVLQGGLNLGGELLDVTILMADIRDFTPMTEKLPPRQLVRLLNRYFTEMVEECLEHGGLIDKFIGDAIMVVFGAPVRLPPEVSALRAARAALGMKRRLAALNAQLLAEGLPVLRVGTGIHTGEAIAGNIGAPQRLDYTVIGDSVNLAARIESATKDVGFDLLISEATRQILGDWVQVGEVVERQLKGKSGTNRIYPLLGLDEERVRIDAPA
ncbi:MAG TPA: adenylate/guanylate cyclase domain-containing protein [Nannocystaceae bacterium]|nr:adenylate/guanylate cyclase domain-containing protein [Nannocystaceae bacterium]